MNKLKFIGCYGILALAAVSFSACSNDDNNEDNGGGNNGGGTANIVWTTDGNFDACNHILFTKDGKDNVSDDGKQIGSGDQNFVFNGKQTLAKGTYELKGWVYIAKGAELTIEKGTIIKGDSATQASLIVEPGGKLIAKGDAQNPIVFTSEQEPGNRRPGDWGGLIICGNGPKNGAEQNIEGGPRTMFGGGTPDANDNSGVLSYVRIEFAGYPFQPDKEINGLTLGAVGAGTQIDHVQVSYSNDDSFEWFGGNVNAKYLIAYKGWDDDFDTDNGYSGNVQFALSVRDPRIADGSYSNGFESDNDANGSTATPFTQAVFSNVTFVGPKATAKAQGETFVNDNTYINAGNMRPKNTSALGRFQSAMQIRRNSHLNCFNSVAVGWPVGLIVENDKGSTTQSAAGKDFFINNVWFCDMDAVGRDANKKVDDPVDENAFSYKFFLAQDGNKYDESYADLFDAKTLWLPSANSALLKAAAWTNAKLSDWFQKVDYIGAFAAGDNWTDGWTNFDPENTKY